MCLNGIIPVNMCYRLISVLPKDVNSQFLVSVNMALFRNRFCVDYCVKMRILGYVLIQYDHVLIKKRLMDGWIPMEGRGGEGTEMNTFHKTWKTRGHQELERHLKQSTELQS